MSTRHEHCIRPALAAFVGLAMAMIFAAATVADENGADGVLVWNEQEIELPYAYVYEIEGFYETTDPSWEIVFSAEPIAERDLDDFFMEFAYVKVRVTRQKDLESGELGELEVFSQNVRPSKLDSNISGGTYPELALDSAGPELFAGRIYLMDPVELFGDTFHYDLTFSAPLSNPNAAIGEPLPAGGGAPGKAYAHWAEAVQSGEADRIMKLLAPVQQEAMAKASEEEIAEGLEFMALMTPTEVEVVGGSSDGEMAVLQVRGTMDGAETKGEITMRLQEGRWIVEGESWE